MKIIKNKRGNYWIWFSSIQNWQHCTHFTLSVQQVAPNYQEVTRSQSHYKYYRSKNRTTSHSEKKEKKQKSIIFTHIQNALIFRLTFPFSPRRPRVGQNKQNPTTLNEFTPPPPPIEVCSRCLQTNNFSR